MVRALCGDAEMVAGATTADLPPDKHSRVVDKTTGVDELVIFHEDQVMPRYLLKF